MLLKIYFILLFILLHLSCSSNINSTINKYGAIAGIVKDLNDTTKNFKSNILLLNINLGCSTGENGKFLLLNVPVGKYEIKATALNYKNSIYQNVRVAEDSVTILRFDMIPNVLAIVPSPQSWDEKYGEIYNLSFFINSGALFNLK